jgi:hypothetical protein
MCDEKPTAEKRIFLKGGTAVCREIVAVLTIFFFASFYAFGVAAQADELLDHSDPQIFRVLNSLVLRHFVPLKPLNLHNVWHKSRETGFSETGRPTMCGQFLVGRILIFQSVLQDRAGILVVDGT